MKNGQYFPMKSTLALGHSLKLIVLGVDTKQGVPKHPSVQQMRNGADQLLITINQPSVQQMRKQLLGSKPIPVPFHTNTRREKPSRCYSIRTEAHPAPFLPLDSKKNHPSLTNA